MTDDKTLQDAYDAYDTIEVLRSPPGPDDALLQILLPDGHIDGKELLRVNYNGRFFVRGEEVTGHSNQDLGAAVAGALFSVKEAHEVPRLVWENLCASCNERLHEGLRKEAIRRLGGDVGDGS